MRLGWQVGCGQSLSGTHHLKNLRASCHLRWGSWPKHVTPHTGQNPRKAHHSQAGLSRSTCHSPGSPLCRAQGCGVLESPYCWSTSAFWVRKPRCCNLLRPQNWILGPAPSCTWSPYGRENSQEMETGQDPRLGDLKPRTLTWAQPGPGPVSHGVGV